MREFTVAELDFLRLHWREDMSSYEIAIFFDCHIADIERARKGWASNILQTT